MIGQVYMITNKLNGMWYIGSHKGDIFKNNYWGSGKLIKRAIKKYGKEIFIRQVIDESIYFKAMEEFYLKSLDAANNPKSYNLKDTAIGGFDYINEQKLNNAGIRKYPGGKGRKKGYKCSREEIDKRISKIIGKPSKNKGKTIKKPEFRKPRSKKHCNWCDKDFQPNIYHRYHNDNCNLNPNFKVESRVLPVTTCPHCNTTGAGNNMARWHFDNCPHKPKN